LHTHNPTSKTLGKLLGVTDTLSNYRAFRKETVSKFNLRGGETFGAEFLVIAKKKGLTIGEIKIDPPPRRKSPRIGGKTKANLRIGWALIKSMIIYLNQLTLFLVKLFLDFLYVAFSAGSSCTSNT
jgi:dolichol-phosphate mannosyltransferase